MNEEKKEVNLSSGTSVPEIENPYAVKWESEGSVSSSDPIINQVDSSGVPVSTSVSSNLEMIPSIEPYVGQEVVPISPVATITPERIDQVETVLPNVEPLPEPPKEEKKNTLKFILLAIFFACLLAFVYFLPNITEFLQERNRPEIKDPTTKPTTSPSVSPTTTPATPQKLICTVPPILGTGMEIESVITVQYIDKKIKSTKVELVQKYASQDENYQKIVNICNTTQIANNTQPGYHSECKIVETTVSVITEFDLKTFRPFTDQAGMKISSTIAYDEDITAFQTKMTSQGAVCK